MYSSQFLRLSLLIFLEGPHHPIITSAEATPRPFPSLSGFQPPEVDGSAVDFPCSILPGSTAEPPVTTDQPDHAQATTPAPITVDQQQQLDDAQQVTAAPKTPAIQSTPRKTTTKRTAPPIRRQPAAEAPIITNGLGTPGSLLLYYLLANQNNGAPGGSSSQSNELYRPALARAWNQRNQQSRYPTYYQPYYQSRYPSYYQPYYQSRYPSYRPYRYPSHSLRQTVGSSSEEFGR